MKNIKESEENLMKKLKSEITGYEEKMSEEQSKAYSDAMEKVKCKVEDYVGNMSEEQSEKLKDMVEKLGKGEVIERLAEKFKEGLVNTQSNIKK